MKAGSVLETIGNTPHIRLSRLFPAAEVWVKSERTNPGGSIKDRIALAMVEDAEAPGQLKPGGLIIEPTSGNTGLDNILQRVPGKDIAGFKIVAEHIEAFMASEPLQVGRMNSLFHPRG